MRTAMRRRRRFSLWLAQPNPRSRAIFSVSDANASSCVSVTLQHLPHSFEIRADDRVLRIERERLLPAAHGLLALLPFEADVAELEVDVVTQRGTQLHGAEIALHRVVVARGAIVAVAEILVQLRQARGLENATLRRARPFRGGAAGPPRAGHALW